MNEPFETTQEFCPKCGQATDVDAIFCKYCAFDLKTSGVNQDVSNEINQSRPKRSIIGIIGVLCLLIFGLIGVAIKFTGGKADQQSAENTNSVSQATTSALMLGEKAQQIEEKILRGEALDTGDLEGLLPQELRILRNVHFARYGRKYERPGLGDYFYNRSWYKPIDNYKDSMINATDKENINLIVAKETDLNNQTTVADVNDAIPEPSVSPPLVTGELTRDDALSLFAGWREDVTRNFPREGNSAIVERLMKDKVITCEKFYPMRGYTDNWRWKDCVPTAKIKGATVDYWAIRVPIGYKAASRITGISRIDQNTAYADVVFTFQEGANYDLYTKYSSENPRTNLGEESRRIVLRLYDDGWRVESK